MSEKTTYSGGNYEVSGTKHDALDRVREADFGSSSQYHLALSYDKLGPLTGATFQIPGGPFSLSSTIRADGTRTKVTYHSGVPVEETRDDTGRLTEVKTFGTSVWKVTSFFGENMPLECIHGGAIRESLLWDKRRRTLARRYETVPPPPWARGPLYL